MVAYGKQPCRAIQDRRVTVESSDKTWSTGEGNSKLFQHSCLENPHKQYEKAKKIRYRKMNPPGSVGDQYATGEEWNERMKRLS